MHILFKWNVLLAYCSAVMWNIQATTLIGTIRSMINNISLSFNNFAECFGEETNKLGGIIQLKRHCDQTTSHLYSVLDDPDFHKPARYLPCIEWCKTRQIILIKHHICTSVIRLSKCCLKCGNLAWIFFCPWYCCRVYWTACSIPSQCVETCLKTALCCVSQNVQNSIMVFFLFVFVIPVVQWFGTGSLLHRG